MEEKATTCIICSHLYFVFSNKNSLYRNFNGTRQIYLKIDCNPIQTINFKMNFCSTEKQYCAFSTFLFGLNIRSLRSNTEGLQLQVEERSPQHIILTGTWFTENDALTHYTINGYQTIESKPRKTWIREGVAPYSKNGNEYEVLEYESQIGCAV